MTDGHDNATTGAPAAGRGASSAPVAADVPCKQCGYNLRGLTPPGLCPECGFDLFTSVRAYELLGRPLPPIDARWARQIAEGAALSVAAFAFVGVAVLSPSQVYRLPYRNAPILETPGRIVLLGIASAWWVLSWYGAWKLATPERRPPGGRFARGWAWAVRGLISAYALIPFAWAAVAHQHYYPLAREPFAWLIILLFYAGLAGCFASVAGMAWLLRRSGAARVAVAEVALLALAVSASLAEAMGNVRDPSSLSLLIALPVFPHGSPDIFLQVLSLLQEGYRVPVLFVAAALPLWSLSVVIRLHLRYRRLAVGPATDGDGRNP